MNRGQYITIRNSGKVDLGLFYNYYKSTANSNKKLLDFATFSSVFPLYFKSNVEEITNFLDITFQVTILSNKEGKFIKAY